MTDEMKCTRDPETEICNPYHPCKKHGCTEKNCLCPDRHQEMIKDGWIWADGRGWVRND